MKNTKKWLTLLLFFINTTHEVVHTSRLMQKDCILISIKIIPEYHVFVCVQRQWNNNNYNNVQRKMNCDNYSWLEI